MYRTLPAWLVAIVAVIAGCGTHYAVTVDTLADRRPHGTRYVIMSGMRDVDVGDLQFGEFATYVDRALRAQGFVPATDKGEADVAIFLSYGIGEPNVVQYEESYPMYGQVSSGGNATATASTYDSGGGYSQTKATIYQPARYGVVGVGTRTVMDISYDRYIELSALDAVVAREANQYREAWRTTIRSTGSSGDLRQVFPAMLAGALQFIGRDTGRAVELEVHANSPVVRWMRTGH